MMKKLFLLAAFVSCMAGVNAQNPKGQFSIKPMAGINVTGLSGGISDMYHYKVRFTAGVEAEYGVNDWLGVSLGAVYSQQGAKVDGVVKVLSALDDGTTYLNRVQMNGKLHCEYINIPLLANFYIPGVKGLAVKAGVQLGLLVGSKMEAVYYTVSVPYTESSEFTIGSSEETHDSPVFTRVEGNVSDVCKSVDFGIPVGLSYEYKNVVLDARYYFGLTKIDKTANPDDCRNRYFSFTLGYRFHL